MFRGAAVPGAARSRALVWPLLLAALGALQTVAFVHTAAWPLPLLATAVLAAAVARAAPGRAALLGWAFGTGWLAAGTWWLFISMHRYGAIPAPLAAAAVGLLAAALSLYLALAMAAFARWRTGRAAPDALLFGALWTMAELARGVLFTGFPWVASGYAQVDAPLAVLLPWVGVYGVGAVAAALAAALAAGWPARVVAVAALGLAALLPAPDFTRAAGTLDVALLQPNVAQDDKFAADRMPETLAWVARALTTAEAPLVIAPETAVPLLPDQLEDFAPGYWAALVAHFTPPGRAALVGVPLGDFRVGYTNSVVGLSEATAAQPYRYDKHHLVPFGEFIPPGFRWFTDAMNIPLGDFNRGPLVAPSFAAAGQRIAPNICYEDLFGEELARRFLDPATAPTMLANVSNIGWFGDTVAVPQHLAISRVRSLELQRPMLRATNTGATAVVDHRGRVTAQLAPFTRDVLSAQAEGRDGVTPYAWWAARAGLWPLAVLAAAAVLWRAIVSGRRG
ncbi:apolipoprotein N-acyltransferase [Rubrivivax albus]|uniref:Apolipoprotein N-acyltransferase n=1 Tax=Rubrivivax albus TaxID=2499835 RepID=A0A437JYZ3_9BURK|nr:apolipoprotein N-acyltransferase [Rubrivivax albus]RVT52855.1 apolipoprotein N-acyltransferase [Rubrivivax albus]